MHLCMMRATHVPNEFLDVSGVIVKVKWSFGERNLARIFPIGNRHIVMRQHGAHGIAKQSGKMSRQWRENQHPGFVQRRTRFFEMKQLTKWFVKQHFFDHFDGAAINFNVRDLECGTRIPLAKSEHQLKAGGHFVGLWGV